MLFTSLTSKKVKFEWQSSLVCFYLLTFLSAINILIASIALFRMVCGKIPTYLSEFFENWIESSPSIVAKSVLISINLPHKSVFACSFGMFFRTCSIISSYEIITPRLISLLLNHSILVIHESGSFSA
jgi:hypothetical protein